jgi:hypothetical protein
MFKLDTPLRGIATGALAAMTLAGALVATTASADARSWRHHHRGAGPGIAAGIIGGLALGALATRPYYGGPRFAQRCWVEPRRGVDRFGRTVWHRVRVCD